MLVVVLALLAASPEQSFEPAGQVVRAPGFAGDVSVASSGMLSLVVWRADGRWGVSRSAIYAGRVNAAGQALDAEGLLVSAPFGVAPSVAWLNAAGAFVVVWQDNDDTFLRLVRVDGTFHPSTLTPRRVGSGRRPFVSANDLRFLVTAESSTPVMWRFSAPATQLDAMPVALSPNGLSWASAVRGAVMPVDRAMVSWVEGMSLMASVVSLDPAGPGPLSLPALLSSPVALTLQGLQANGSDALVAFRTHDNPTTPLLSTMRFSAGARAPPEAWDAGTSPIDNAELSVLGTGDVALLATLESGDAVGWLLSDAGAQGVGVVETSANRVTTSRLGARELVAMTGAPGVTAHLATQQLVPVTAPVPLGNSRGGHQAARVAAWAQGYVASWSRLTSDADLVTWRTSATGVAAPAADLVLASSRYAEPSLISYSGGVAWLVDSTTLRVMSASGVWADRVLPKSLDYGSIATDREGRLVGVGVNYTGPVREGWALRLEADGGVTERLVFPDGSPKPYRSRVAFARDGSGGLVISNWSEQVWANRLTSDLVPLDDAGFVLSPPTSVGALGGQVVADTEGGYLVFSTNYNDVQVRRLSGTVVSAVQPVVLGAWDLSSVAEVPEGALVVATSRATADVVAVLVKVVGGAITVSAPVTVATGGEATNGAAVAVRPDGFCFVYGRVDLDAGVATTRYQVWSSLAGSVCSQSWQCASGRCVSGLCGADAGVIITPIDGGVPIDGGFFEDAGMAPDGGLDVDAGTLQDAGVEVDAGADVDGGLTADAGFADDPNRRTYRAGCDCQQAGGLSSLVLAVVLARRRRR